MDLKNCKLIIDNKEFIVSNVRIEFVGDNLKANVEGFCFQDIVYNHQNCKSVFCLNEEHKGDIMSEPKLYPVPENLARFINENFKAFYQLDWVDKDLNLTDKGRDAIDAFLLKTFEEKFGEYAREEVSKLEDKTKEAEEKDEE